MSIKRFLCLEDLDIMYGHAVSEYPNECCGVIMGKLGEPEKSEVRPGANIQHQLKEQDPLLYNRDADTGYFLDPKELMATFKEASEKNLDIIGFYHSHPNHEAYWSQEDHRAAMWAGTDEPSFPDAFHVVISIFSGEVRGHALFLWDAEQGKFVQQSDE